jgi:N-carbamoyl-L-amino-acid hydrolase
VLQINSGRLWQSLMDLARIGATARGGVRRLTLTDADRRGRDQFVAWCREAGLSVEIDGIGNIFGRRPGADPAAPPVAIGSHLDSQPSGGKFDGAYGVMAGLEIVRALNDAGVRTRAPLEVVSWTNEEGSRFVPTLMGSGVFAGVFPLESILGEKDVDGISVREALADTGYAGQAQPHRLGAYFEAHIEQGPVLEQTGTTIGVVQGALGQRWFDVAIAGQDSHAGPTPMETRRDALLAASRLVLEVNRIGTTFPDYARGTVGFMQVKPNSRNVVPGEVRMTVDLRNARDATLGAMVAELKGGIPAIEKETRTGIALKEVVYFPPSEFDAGLVASVREGSKAFGYSHRDIVSGAAHDAVYMARIAPTAMVFVPCEGGISHNEVENARPADLAAGCNVLLHAVLARAGVA